MDKYVATFGKEWVQTRTNDKGQTLVRLRPLSEFRCFFEQPEQFLLIQSEEITEKAHLNAINVLELIPPQGGDTITEIMQNKRRCRMAPRPKKRARPCWCTASTIPISFGP